MKKIMTIMLFILTIAGCSTHKKASSTLNTSLTDASHYNTGILDVSRADSISNEVRKKVTERAETGTVKIERGEVRPADPFTITAAFRLDSSAALQDTLRLVSMENEEVKLEVYHDRKTGQTIAQVQGKGGKVNKTPFETITITNASVTKNTDSSGKLSAKSFTEAHASVSDSTIDRQQQVSLKTSSQLDRSQTGVRNIVLGIVAIVMIASAILFILKKKLFN